MNEPRVPKRKGALIWRRPGKGIFIGRRIRVTVIECSASSVKLGIEAPLSVVSNPGVSFEEHLARQADRDLRREEVPEASALATVVLGMDEAAQIGREVVVEYVGQGLDDSASLSVRAPMTMAVTRDDRTFEDHMLAQQRRDEVGR